jgi:putative transposase
MTFYRRNLPHWHPEGKTIFITWRLYGSLPASLLKKNPATGQESAGQRFGRLDGALDAARSGPHWLAVPEFAAYAEYPILRGAELGRYRLHAYVVMPNHVHILLDPHIPLAKISGVIKGVSSRDINARLGRSGRSLWQDESSDHWIRSSVELERIRQYIDWNPVRAGLVSRPKDWKWSSAGNPYFQRLIARLTQMKKEGADLAPSL